MSRVAIVAVAGALSLPAATAMAADMPNTLPPAYETHEVAPARIFDFNSGWYLRGDLGYDWGRIEGAQSATGFPSPTSNKLNGAAMAGVGAGIKTQWLRTDFTVDYSLPMKYEGSILAPNDTTAKISAVSMLFNGYLDLGTWYRLTPYVGGGVGVSYTRVSDLASTAVALSGDTSKNQWNFAWAGMAGVAFALSHNILMDVGYRYLSLGDVSTASNPSGAMTFKNVAAHEVRVGLRWSFDDLRFWH